MFQLLIFLRGPLCRHDCTPTFFLILWRLVITKLSYITCKFFNNKNTLFRDVFCFFCHNTFWLFLKQLHCLFSDIAHFLPQINYILFVTVMLHCFNTTFFPCFFCNFCNHIIHTQEKSKFFWWHKVFNNFSLKCLILYYLIS